MSNSPSDPSVSNQPTIHDLGTVNVWIEAEEDLTTRSCLTPQGEPDLGEGRDVAELNASIEEAADQATTPGSGTAESAPPLSDHLEPKKMS